MEVIAAAFEDLGYRWAYRVVDARAFGLPQRRRRVYFVASLKWDPRSILFADETDPQDEDENPDAEVACGFYWTEGIRGLGWAVDAVPTLKGGSTVGIPSAPAILLPSHDVVVPDIRDAERLQGFPSDWTKPAELVVRRGARWKLVGNAVSVPAATWIGSRFRHPRKPLSFEAVPLQSSRTWPTAAWNIGDGRKQVMASEWPDRKRYTSLASFLKYPPTPLSPKATAGFLKRTERSSLNFPRQLIPALKRHLKRVSRKSEKTRAS
jgi:DNA (cytosine-5)-methyltransferase 1